MPSGIAQLRKSAHVSVVQTADPMNLDDFILPTSVASPAGLTPDPPIVDKVERLRLNEASTTPIKSRIRPQVEIPPATMPPSSMPKSSIASSRAGEFDYVKRRVRKTSIDERRVHVLA